MFSNIWPKETKATAWKQKWDALSILVKMSSNFNCSYMARSSLTYIPGFSVKFFFHSQFIPIVQIRHILIKDHISSLKPLNQITYTKAAMDN
jgi:hypothetical protein